jgi:hypothetical protein
VRKFIVLFVFLGVFSHPYSALGLKNSKISGKISLGYDNLSITQETTQEATQANSKVHRSFSSLYLDSKLPLFPHQKQCGGVFRFQNGLKLLSKSENIVFNQANLGLAFLISPKISSEILCELKRKHISSAEDLSVVLGEYGYLYWHSGVSLKFNGNDFNSSIRYLHRQRDYTDNDFFDSKDHQFQLMTNAFFTRTLTGCLTGKVETSRLSRHQASSFEKHTDEQYTDILLENDSLVEEHDDTLYEISLGSQWIDNFLISPSYAFQRNISDHSEYSFNAHQFSILAALPLYWEMTLQCYGRLQLCKYKSQKLPLPSPLDEDNIEQSHKVLVFSLSRDIFKSYSLEVRYLFSRTGISSSSEECTKQSCSFTVSYEF